MDPTIFIGLAIVLGILLETIGIEMGMKLFFSKEAFIVVGCGLLATTLINFPLAQLKSLRGWIRVIFFTTSRNHREDILYLVRLSFQIHKQGHASLENEIDKIKDTFLRYAVIQIQHKTPPEQLKLMLKEMIESSEKRHEMGIHYFEQMAKYAPGLALVGTLIGLVQLLSNLEDPKTIGPNMAIALVSTFYGVGAANLLFLPLSGRLRVASYAERVHKEILIEGIMAIAQGELPFVVREKIYSLVTEKDRAYLKKFEKKA